MKFVIGIVLVIGGIALGSYVGIWIYFIGGIIDVITEIRAEELIAFNVAVGVAKVFFSGFLGWLSGVVLVLPGVILLKD